MKLRAIEEKFNIGTWSWNLKTGEIAWSSGMFRIVGFEPSSVVPTLDLYQSLVHPDDQLDFSNAVGLAQGTRLQDRTFRIIRPDGSLRWLRSKAQPYFDRDGTPTSMFGVIADVTDMQELTAETQREASLRQAFIRLLGGHVWRAYPDGRLVETTEWSKLTGQTPAEARDWEKLAAIHPEDRKTFRDAWATAISTGQQFQVTIRVKSLDGDYVRLTGIAVAIRNADETIREWVGYTSYDNAEAIRPMGEERLDPAQIRGARAMVGWSASQLAKKSGVSFSTIRRMEVTTAKVRKDALSRVRKAFELEGVHFLYDGQGGISVGLSAAPHQ
jgi:PAS domain S-box-containing protein